MSTTGILLYGFYLGTEDDVDSCNPDLIAEWKQFDWDLQKWWKSKNFIGLECPVTIIFCGCYEFPGYYLALDKGKNTVFYGEDYHPRYFQSEVFTNFLAIADAKIKLQSFRDQFKIIPKDKHDPCWILTGYDN